jgi:hypothetical protein
MSGESDLVPADDEQAQAERSSTSELTKAPCRGRFATASASSAGPWYAVVMLTRMLTLGFLTAEDTGIVAVFTKSPF